MKKLTDLPPELLWLIVEELQESPKAMSAFLRTSRPLYRQWRDSLWKARHIWVEVLLSAAKNGNFWVAKRAAKYDPMRDPGYANSRVILDIRRRVYEEANEYGFEPIRLHHEDYDADRYHPDEEELWPNQILDEDDEHDLDWPKYPEDRLTMAENANVTHLAFALALGHGHLDIARLLWPTGRPIDTVITRRGRTALHYAAWWGSQEGVKFLVQRGADVNAADPAGDTAITLAARSRYSNPSCVKRLLAYGADINACCYGRTALSYAISCHHNKDVVEALLGHGDDLDLNLGVETPLMAAIENVDYDLVSRLLQRGADPNVGTYEERDTALTLAIRSTWQGAINWSCGKAVIRMLLDSGADVNAARDENTPLLCALMRQQEATVRMLLEQGADVHAIDSWGRTALMIAIESFAFPAWRIEMELIRELLLRGADPNIEDWDWFRALDYVWEYNRPKDERSEVIRLLCAWGAT